MTAVEWLGNEWFYLDQQFDMCLIDRDIYLDKLRQIQDQAKEMEKEQMINFAEFVATYPDKNININGEMLHAKSKYDGAERTIDLLETFKSE